MTGKNSLYTPGWPCSNLFSAVQAFFLLFKSLNMLFYIIHPGECAFWSAVNHMPECQVKPPAHSLITEQGGGFSSSIIEILLGNDQMILTDSRRRQFKSNSYFSAKKNFEPNHSHEANHTNH